MGVTEAYQARYVSKKSRDPVDFSIGIRSMEEAGDETDRLTRENQIIITSAKVDSTYMYIS